MLLGIIIVTIATYCLRGLDHKNFKDLKVEIIVTVAGEWKKRRRYFQRLGIELEDLVQGVAERLARIDRRVRKGEHNPKVGSVKTWKSSHIKWAVNDVVRAYQWSGSTYDRNKSKAYNLGKEQEHVFEVYGEEEAERLEGDGKVSKGKIREGSYPAYQVEAIEARETLCAVLEIMQSCTLRAQRVFYDYFVRERTMKAIGIEYHITESRISQLIKHVRNRLVRGLIIRNKTGCLSRKMIEDGYYRL